jgi:hypothetical protein
MRPIGARPELEEATRTAAIAAVTFMDSAKTTWAGEGSEVPRFNGSRFLVPRNAAAEAMVAECTKHLPAELVGIDRETIITTACDIASYVRKHGGGDAGWSELTKHLAKK